MKGPFDELQLLRGANPVATEPDRGRSEPAQAALLAILEQPVEAAAAERAAAGSRYGRARWRNAGRSSRRLSVLVAAVVLAGGTAIAATDPLGWWSANPTYAHYGSNPEAHVRTPTAATIACSSLTQGLKCSVATYAPGSPRLLVHGRRTTLQGYTFVDAVRAPPKGLTREHMLATVARERAAGTISAAQADRFRRDLVAVPDSFFTEFQEAMRYGTFGSGSGPTRKGLTLVPPAGVPATIVCEAPAGRLTCQNLNGDLSAPVGGGIYAANAARDWRYRHVPPENWTTPPGISFTPAEYRVLIDLLTAGTVKHSISTVGRATATIQQSTGTVEHSTSTVERSTGTVGG